MLVETFVINEPKKEPVDFEIEKIEFADNEIITEMILSLDKEKLILISISFKTNENSIKNIDLIKNGNNFVIN